MGIEDLTVDELLAGLAADIPPELGENEFTVMMLAREFKLDHKTLKRKYIPAWVKAGKLEPVGLRRIGAGPDVEAYKLCNKR